MCALVALATLSILHAAPGAIDVGTCAETTFDQTLPPAKGAAQACAVLGQEPDCPVEAVEWFEASDRSRRLWVLPRSTDEGSLAWARLDFPPRKPAFTENPEALGLEPGATIGEDALVPAPPRTVPCGQLRPRWVDAAPTVRWADAVLIVSTRIDIAKEREEEQARKAAFARAAELEVPARYRHIDGFFPPKTRSSRFRWNAPQRAWVRPDGERTSFREELESGLEATLRKHGWRRVDEPPQKEKLPAYVELMLARNPLMEKLLRVQGGAAPEVETVATYRMEGSRYRFVLTRTDYTETFLRLEEPIRSRVWSAIHDWPGGVVEP